MATYTTYYNLKKPQATDTTEIITDLNANYDTIDTALYGKASTSHASTHITGGTDVIPNAVAGGNSGLMSGADKQNLDDAVTKKHDHTNKALLDTYTQTEANLADAVAKKHDHTNKALLDTYTQTQANLIADAVSKKHSQNTDQYLDYGGTNQVAAADVKAAVTNSHKIYISTSDPSGGSDGEVWFKYTA